ncbi:MAG: bifunctional phosphopantothenoylcysteine decarboxylase/phosphopantothenate--cysteine ligase CoaBC [Lachnospiraceae bacterium]|jgi:phosphopantothenoylcysteine decarboxylase/phosphopantothenate--cysteine ligase|nr:bifunctional phosphopantothenoylcysteine decarboxylase/phosphopantothenate--cysteine ligase CoaBC [Lachnospiraceae bacterium]
MLQGKHILLGVTGSIAAYKIANLASMLKKRRANVTVMMTQNATQFIHPITFETLTQNKCLVDTFDRSFEYSVEHVALAKSADVLLVAPASANVIGKLASGIADDMLTTTCLACKCPKLIAPAMNTQMFENPILQDNLHKLTHYGMKVISPAEGYLACSDIGMGRLPSEELLLEYILKEIAYPKDLAGRKVLVTAGPTREALDPVRFLSNHSTGKMGYAIARACMLRGADVTLVTGQCALTPPPFVKVIPIVSALELFEAVEGIYAQQDIIIKAAAVADYKPAQVSAQKLKKDTGLSSIPLTRTTDILAYLGQHKKPGQFLCGFSMETEHMIENAQKKLVNKNLDLIAANNLSQAGAGFATDTNVLTLITKDEVLELPMMSKEEAAHQLLDRIVRLTCL